MPEERAEAARYSKEQGRVLLELARRTICKELGIVADDGGQNVAALRDPDLQAHCGVFVTLHRQGQLRGCIGSIIGMESIVSGIAKNAINAAFHDPRFAPLQVRELPDLDIEISILTDPAPLEYRDPPDLLAKLRPGIDGVILRKGMATSTFLPQVWEQLPDPEDFLSHLSMKAGLPADAWQTMALEVSTYQVQHFEEKAPVGP